MKGIFYWAIVGFVILGLIGWVLNIITLFGASFDPFTGELLLRIIGIFVGPLGAIMGYL